MRSSPGGASCWAGSTCPFDRGLAGHSDADVLLHAICDAILGAIGEGDIGRHFPDTDDAYKDADSRVLLRQVWQRASAAGYVLGNRRWHAHRAGAAAGSAYSADGRQYRRRSRSRRPLRSTSRRRRPRAWALPGAAKASPRWRPCCCSSPGVDARQGSVTRASVPPPSRDVRSRVPPCMRAMRSTIASPSPAPVASVRADSPRVNGRFSRSTSGRPECRGRDRHTSSTIDEPMRVVATSTGSCAVAQGIVEQIADEPRHRGRAQRQRRQLAGDESHLTPVAAVAFDQRRDDVVELPQLARGVAIATREIEKLADDPVHFLDVGHHAFAFLVIAACRPRCRAAAARAGCAGRATHRRAAACDPLRPAADW